MDETIKKGPGAIDQWLFRLWNRFRKILSLFIYYLTMVDGVIWSGFWVIPKIALVNLCKSIHDIINYSTLSCPFESGKCEKEWKKIQKFEYPEIKKSFFEKIKKHFLSFLKGYHLVKKNNKKLIKNSDCWLLAKLHFLLQVYLALSILFVLTLASGRAILSESVMVVVLQLWYSSFLTKVFVFQRFVWKLKTEDTQNFQWLPHKNIPYLSSRRLYLKSLVSFFRRTHALSVDVEMKSLRKSVFFC